MFCLHDSAPMYSYVKFNFKASLFFQLFDLRTPSGGEMDLKIWPRAQGKMGQKYQKNTKWQKISFQGPIWVPKVPFWGFWGLVCIEKWSQKFVSGTRSAIFGTPEMAKTGSF